MSRKSLAEGDSVLDVDAWFEELEQPWQPYSGEIKHPATILDRIVLEAIERCGDDNDVAKLNPYHPSSRPALMPGAETLGNTDDRMQFGEDFLTYHAPFRQDDKSKIIYVYSKEHGQGRVIIDDFEGDPVDGRTGGLVARTWFSAQEDFPELVHKRRQTDFVSFIGSAAINPVDTSRELKNKETAILLSVLVRPGLLVASEDELSPADRKQRRAFYVISGENSKEVKMRQRAATEAALTIKEHYARVEARNRAQAPCGL